MIMKRFFAIFCAFSLLSCTMSALTDNITYFNLPECLAFVALKVELLNTKASTSIVLPVKQDLNPAESKCTTRGSSIGFSYANVGEITKMDLNLNFQLQRQHWVVKDSKVALSCIGGSKTCVAVDKGRLDLSWLTASTGLGFKCTKPPLARVIGSSGKTPLALKFTWLQVQPMGAKAGKFGPAIDCTTFFTIPIWSTLLVSFLLVGILSYGLHMLMSIKPNELYDDPKIKMVQLGGAN